MIPKTIYANSGFDPFGGIISKIKKYSNNPIADNIVVPSAVTTPYGNCNYTVNWDGDFATMEGSNAYLIIQFPGKYLFPTHYTIRGVKTNYWAYPKTWKVFGYNKGEENDSNRWTLLAFNESTVNTYCGNETRCITTRRSTIFSMIPTNKGFEYIRFVAITCSGTYLHFTTSGIEFFGILSVSSSPNRNPFRCTIYNCFRIDSVFVNSFSIFLLSIHLHP
jgi:hypothetical protein